MKKGGRLTRLLGTPARALSRACDFYVRGMSRCAGCAPMGAAAVGRKFGAAADMRSVTFGSGPRRWAGSGRDEDVDEHIRAALRKRVSNATAGRPTAPTCKKVLAGRIDEDAVCEFANDVRVGAVLPPGRRSVAVGGLAARAGGFGAMKTGARVFAE